MNKILSIIIPVFNVEQFVFKTLDSIFSQEVSLEEYEVIIVNDGTLDHSMDIVKKFSSKYINIKVINQVNQGLSVARNSGLKLARGKYVWFVDSDDWIEKDCLAKILNTLENVEADVFIYKIREYNEEGHVLLERRFVNNDVIQHCSGAEVIMNLSRHQVMHTPMQMHIIRRSFLIDNNMWFIPGIYHEDIDFASRMLVKTDSVVYVPIVSYCYLKRTSGSITSNAVLLKKRVKSLLYIYDSHREILLKEKRYDRKKALWYDLYRIACYIWRILPEPLYSEWYKELNLNDYIKAFRKPILKNIACDRPLWKFPSRFLFLLSPHMLKKIGKSF